MKKILLFIFTCFVWHNYAQTLSKTNIIYERKDQIVMNDGQHYEIIVNTPFYEMSSSSTVEKYKEVSGHVLYLNRVLILRNNNAKKQNKYIEVTEWVKEDMKLYASRELRGYNPNTNSLKQSYHSYN